MADGDLDALARRYFELWQSQLSGLAADRELSGSLARLMAAANAQIEAAFGARDGRSSTQATGAASAATASGDSAVDGRQLGERMAALERRIAELERKLADARPAKSAKPAKSRRSAHKPATPRPRT